MNKRKKIILLGFLLLSSSVVFSQQQQTAIDSLIQGTIPVNRVDHSKDTYTLPLKEDMNSSIEVRKFKTNFKRKYKNDSSFDYDIPKEKKTSIFELILKKIDRFFDRLFNPMNISYSTISTFGKILRVLGVLLFIALIYYLVRAFIQNDIYWGIKKKSRSLAIKLQDVENDLENANFPELIAQMLRKKEYRICIRFYYLWLLQNLQEQNIIEWHIEKTNTDYLDEIKSSEVKERFRYLSYLYNHIWYGEHIITEYEFNKAKTAFDQTLKPFKHE